MGPTAPVVPAAPEGPAAPVGPVAPSTPLAPVGPVGPTAPVVPAAPEGPAVPVGPVAPSTPLAPVGPVGPTAPVVPAAPEGPVAPPPVKVVQDTVPKPSVVNNCPAVPSILGYVTAPVVKAPLVATLVTLMSPSCILLLASTSAFAPIAVALLRLPEATLA